MLHEETYIHTKENSSRTKTDTILHQDQVLRRFSQDGREREKEQERERERERESFTKTLLKRPVGDIKQTWSDHPTSFVLSSVMFRGTLHNFFLSHQDLRPHQTPSKHALKIACRPILLFFALLLKPGPSLKGSYLRCMKTHINIKQQSSAITTLHEDKLRSRLQEAMLTYSTPHLWLSCLDYAVSWEVCFTALQQLCTSSSIFSIFLT